jgi:dienelactone hydrolase
VLLVVLVGVSLTSCGSKPASSPAAKPEVRQVTFPSRGLRLTGYLWVPSGGHGKRYPAVVWNHGSDPTVPTAQGEALADFYNRAGFVFFMPIRQGHLPSPGDYRRTFAMLVAEEDDVAAGVAYLKGLAAVDPNGIVVSGVSNGGIMSLLAAEAGLGLRAAVAFAPGAQSWENPDLRGRLITAAENVKIPTFVIQAGNDYNLGPTQVLGKIVADNNITPHEAKLYPAYGTTAQDGHGRFAIKGFGVWGADVLRFIRQAFARP